MFGAPAVQRNEARLIPPSLPSLSFDTAEGLKVCGALGNSELTSPEAASKLLEHLAGKRDSVLQGARLFP
jgi:hypothetical protein